MKKTKILIALFVILLGGCIFGAVKMLMLTKNQKIEDFKIETVNGYDAAVMNDILLDVDYNFNFYESNLQYYNGKIVSQEFNKKIRIFSEYEEQLYLSEDRFFALHGDDGYGVFEGNEIVRWIGTIVPGNIQERNSFCEDILVKDSENVYLFDEKGFLCTIAIEELNGLYKLTTQKKTYVANFVVPNEVDVIVGARLGDISTVAGVGDITNEGYTLYIYAIDRETGVILNRDAIKKERKVADSAIVGGDLMFVNNMDVVTIMDAAGQQDMYFIEWDTNTMECEVTEYDVSKLLGDENKICGMFDLECKDGITYICYAEGVTGEVIENEEWARRNIADIQSVGFYSYENRVGVDFSGVAIIAIEDNAVIYKGYLSSESYKGRADIDAIITRIRMIAS